MWDALSRFRSLTMLSSTCPRGALLDSSSSSSNVQVRNTSASEVARHRASSKQQATSDKQAGQQASASASGNCQCTRHLFPDASNTHSPWSRYVWYVTYYVCTCTLIPISTEVRACMLSPPTARLSIMMAVPALPRSRSIFHGTTCSNLHLVSLQQIPQSS